MLFLSPVSLMCGQKPRPEPSSPRCCRTFELRMFLFGFTEQRLQPTIIFLICCAGANKSKFLAWPIHTHVYSCHSNPLTLLCVTYQRNSF